MNVRVLGSYGSRIPGHQTSCLLVDDSVVIDAGGITGMLSVEEQLAIDHVLISHAHLDHVYDLAFLADNVMVQRSSPLCVWAPAEVLTTLRENLFNNKIWPDLSQVRVGDFPVVKFFPLPAGKKTQVGAFQVEWVPTQHTVFSAGYLMSCGETSILFSGDTTETEALWALGKKTLGLVALFVETSFPDRLESLALETGHLTPSLLQKELAKLDKPDLPVKIFHMKPQYLEEICNELEPFQDRCQILEGNERFHF